MTVRPTFAAACALALMLAGCAASEQAASRETPVATATPLPAPSGGASGGASQSAADAGAQQIPVEDGAGARLDDSFDAGWPGLPVGAGASLDDVLRGGPILTWRDPGDALVVTVPAGDRCTPVLLDTTATPPDGLELRFDVLPPAGCEETTAARSFSVSIPDSLDATATITITMTAIEGESFIAELEPLP